MPRFKSPRVCLVTGGASGLGRATAIDLAQYGNIVAVGDINDAAGGEVVAEIEAAGGHGLFHPLDVTDRLSVREFVGKIVDTFGRLDCAVNNAGVEGQRVKVADYPDDEWQRIIDINLTGVFTCMKHELAVMTSQGGGSIVNVGSTGSLRGIGLMSAYVSSKHALVGLTKTAAIEYAAQNVRINVLCPGGFRTPMSDRLYNGDFSGIVSGTPMGRMAPAEEIAQVIVWLCSDEASFVTGAAYQVDGGRMAGPVLAG
jgi:NAD(P)-dependent dehydrogenase (short-subunit alcohol dehydrogenase family)